MITRKAYLQAKSIVEEFEKDPKNIDAVKNPLPMYIKLRGIAMQYDHDFDEYYRHAGCWSTEYKYLNGVLVSHIPDYPNIHEQPLIEITEEEWRNGNKGYVK